MTDYSNLLSALASEVRLYGHCHQSIHDNRPCTCSHCAALAAYDAHVAKQAIVQTPGGPQCSHAYAVEAGRCVGCGAEVG